jgi:hypothetical protein
MGGLGNNLRHLGMIATSNSWRRFFAALALRKHKTVVPQAIVRVRIPPSPQLSDGLEA